ncbi:gluconeogenesis factor YvcK family protein [Fusibacter ferrireducens]|uniref:Putative gluconeogenesis factor n=1 Tax=Fusibacter ferrireducens TaxID=2785058 RepID=A0ABR9ZZ14_9FIRM|nr:uridine diphosphate-N-acetylglucosamine-binding protein YvcK [Fusibacter ferrireducens]MBF4695403.1 uridine diphosphate-N-acetylglucosamine-binding protein YvcK [Fusibacter ferrireducens]
MLNIVAIGGGTGLSIILRGLKEISTAITAIVTVADDGGGSGVLREDLGMLPPGDVRNCILALANKEPILQDLFQYRFEEGRLKGQNFGNLMIAAMVGISDNFESAIRKISDIFAITGEVYPVSEDDLVLYAKLDDGATVIGESNIPLEVLKRGSQIEKIWIEPSDASTSDVILKRIEAADVIVLGPGSLYTSIIPNLLVPDIARAINETKASVFYVANIMTQPGETDTLTAGEHLELLFKHTALSHVDFMIANSGDISTDSIRRYEREEATPVRFEESDKALLSTHNVTLIEGNFVDIKKGYIRHDAPAIAKEITGYVERSYNLKKSELNNLSKTI